MLTRIVLAAAIALLATPAAASAELDAIVRGGTVFDGSGLPGRVADIGIEDGRIHRIGDLSGARAKATYDARGLNVTPGFIDVHAHTDTGAPLADAKSALTQGVTTEMLGPDGGGEFAIAAQLAQLRSVGKGINVAPYVGFNTVWEDTMGQADVRPTEAQLERMRARIEQAMREGAWSVSSGLGYTPAAFARTDEVIEVVKAARPWRAMFTDHIRDETNLVMESTNENLVIGQQSGLMAEVTHMKVAGPLNWGKSSTILRLQAGSRAAGTHAGGDVYPYTAAMTGLAFYVPQWAKDGGVDAMLARFADPAQRARIDKEVSDFVVADVGVPENIAFPSLANKTLKDFVAEYGGVTIGEAVMRILEAHRGDIGAVMHIGSEDDLKRFLADPFVSISSDGGVTDSGETHPRHYGAYPRVLGRYVREQGVLGWAEAIRKMSGLPATMAGMVDRGFLAEGMAADVTVFDPRTIVDRATFAEPRQYAEGVRWVFVNGRLALDRGESTGARSGAALARASSMPTRPQSVGARRASVAGRVTPVDGSRPLALRLALAQGARDPSARGTLTVPGRLRATRLGTLQTAPGWLSITGIGRTPGGAERAFLVTVDERDPLARPGETRATIRIDGAGEVHGTLRVRR